MEILDIISQIGVSIFGVLAIVLVSLKNKWGFVFGLMSQPFWFITSFANHQWGVFFLTIVYSISWTYGIYQWFFKNQTS